MLSEVVDRKCVGGIWYASARAAGVDFEACSFRLATYFSTASSRFSAPPRASELRGGDLSKEGNGSTLVAFPPCFGQPTDVLAQLGGSVVPTAMLPAALL